MKVLIDFSIGAGIMYGCYSLNNILSKVFGYDNLYLCMFLVIGIWTIVRCVDYHPEYENKEEEENVDEDKNLK